jgi:hypothetical protein
LTTTHFYTIDTIEVSAAVANMGATLEGAPFAAQVRSGSDFVPMYRVKHPAYGTQLLTTFIDERDATVNEEEYPGAGIAFWCLPPDASVVDGTAPLFRAYNPLTDDHFYSLDKTEAPSPPYRREGIACLIFTTQMPGTTPLYRFRSQDGQIHVYTTQPNIDILGQHFIQETSPGFVLENVPATPQPFFRSYNPATGGHLYTLDINEHDNASNKDGYRGDGIAFYIWHDGAQPNGAVKLMRAYNQKLDDHFYTTDTKEFKKAVGPLNYADEGIAGWVLPPQMGTPLRRRLITASVSRLLGSFADDFFLLPDNLPASLSSASNFILTSTVGAGIDAITGLQVDLDITSDLTMNSVDRDTLGMSFQLNAVSPEFYTSSWQQFVLVFSGGDIGCQIQNWAKSPYAIADVSGTGNVCHIGGNTLKAGHRLRVKLLNDDFANILGADFYVYKGKKTLGHCKLLVKDFPGGVAQGAAPIVGCQMVLVGNGDFQVVTLAPGTAGLITYTAEVPLCAGTMAPPNIEISNNGMTETGEGSNCTYGEIASTKSKILTQTFGVSAQSLSVLRPGTPSMRLRRPRHR